jgi:hypothetical protein
MAATRLTIGIGTLLAALRAGRKSCASATSKPDRDREVNDAARNAAPAPRWRREAKIPISGAGLVCAAY